MERLSSHQVSRRGRRDRYLEEKLEAAGVCSLGNTGGPGSDSSNRTTTTTTNTDKRQVVDTGSVGVSSDNSTVYVAPTDLGAISRSFDLATTSSEQTLNSVAKALGFASDANTKALNFAGESSSELLAFAGNTFGRSLDLADEGLKAVQAAGTGISDAYKSAASLSSGQAYLVAGVVGAVVIVAVIALKHHKG
jgi:hypothetical protein